jgi:hypothetical protein
MNCPASLPSAASIKNARYDVGGGEVRIIFARGATMKGIRNKESIVRMHISAIRIIITTDQRPTVLATTIITAITISQILLFTMLSM